MKKADFKNIDFKLLTEFCKLIFATESFATGSAKIGGTFVNSDETTFKVSIDDQRESGKWQQVFEFDYVLKESQDVKTLDEIYTGYKVNYTFAPKHYVSTNF